MNNNIKLAKEILREMEVSSNYGNETMDHYIVDTDEDHVVNAMIVYAQQFIDLAADKANFEYIEDSEITERKSIKLDIEYLSEVSSEVKIRINKGSILNIKKQII